MRTLADEVVAVHGQVDGLLNVAGIIQRFVPFADLPRAEMEKVMGVNFWGVVNTCSAFLPLLRERPEACVVNVSSMGDDIAKAAARLTTPQAAAEQIVDAVRSGAYRVVIGKDAKGLDVMMRLNPRRATDLIAKKMASLIAK